MTVDILSYLPNDLLINVNELLPITDNITLSTVNKSTYNQCSDWAFDTYKIDSSFTMAKLKLMLKHINGIRTLIVDYCDIFFIAQIQFPNLKEMWVQNCAINKSDLELYKHLDLNFVNCQIR
jgi:hypothetical protein